MTRADEIAVRHLPLARGIRLIRLPSRQVFAIEQWNWLAPLWRAGSFQGWRSLSRPRPRGSILTGGRPGQHLPIHHALEDHVILAIFVRLGRNKSKVTVGNCDLRKWT